MEQDLIVTPGLPAGPVRLHGIEIVFAHEHDKRGRLWIPLSGRNHLIYGRNGVGKSTVLDCVRSALQGILPKTPHVRVDLFIEIDRSIDVSTFAKELDFEIIDNPDVEFSEDDVDTSFDDDDEDELVDDFFEEGEEDDVEDGGDDAADEETLSEIRGNFSFADFVSSISKGGLISGLYAPHFISFEEFHQLQTELMQPEFCLAEDQFRRVTWEEDAWISLEHARAAWVTYFHLSDRTLGEFDREPTNCQELISTAYREAAHQDFYCLTPVGSLAKPEWNINIAVKLGPDTPSLEELDRINQDLYVTEVASAFEEFGSMDEVADFINESDFLRATLPSQAMTDWENPITQFLGPLPTHPFRKMRPWSDSDAVVSPADIQLLGWLEVVNLSDPFDYERWRKSTLKGLFPRFSRSESWSVLFAYDAPRSDEFGGPRSSADFESGFLTSLGTTIEQSSRLVRKMDIGITDLRVELRSDISEWIEGRGLALKAQDESSAQWIDYEMLSRSQQSLIGSAIRICGIRDGIDNVHRREDRTVVVMGDEPDQNLHPLAVRDFYRVLHNEIGCSFLATHSPVALSMPEFQRLHAYRDADGHLCVRSWSPNFDQDSLASDLGVDKASLLSAVGLVVLVEGAHDEEVLRVLLPLTSPAIQGQVLVLPMRGHRKMNTLADSFVWISLTDARILAVVDNARAQRFDTWSSSLTAAVAEGLRIPLVAKRFRADASAEKLTPEEETVVELLDRALHNGSLSRVHAFGLSKGDIIEYASPVEFGLSQDWESLREDHRQSGSRASFKDWLREERGARISSGSVRNAFANLDGLHPDLVNLLDRIQSII